MTEATIGYRYQQDVLCGSCIKKVLPTDEGETFDGWADATGTMGAEEFLQGIADAFGIDRATFHNTALFPVAVQPLDFVEGIPACDRCGEILF